MAAIHFEDDSDDENVDPPMRIARDSVPSNDIHFGSTMAPPIQNPRMPRFGRSRRKERSISCQFCMVKCLNSIPEQLGFSDYEIRNYIQDTTFAEIEDITVCRDRGGICIGIVFVRFLRPVSSENVFKLNGTLFKNMNVVVTMFTNVWQYERNMYLVSEKKIKSVVLPPKPEITQVYIKNFEGTREDLLPILKTCVSEEEPTIVKKTANTFSYYVATYKSKGNALKISRTFNGYSLFGQEKLNVKPLFQYSAERSLIIYGCEDESWMKKELTNHGKLSSFDALKDNSIIAIFESLDEAKAAGLFLDGATHDNFIIKIRFIDYFRARVLIGKEVV